MATHYLIKQKKRTFLTNQLNIFYPLKDSRSLLFRKFPLELLNPSRSFLKFYIIFTFTSYFTLLYFLYFYLFPGILEFGAWWLWRLSLLYCIIIFIEKKKDLLNKYLDYARTIDVIDDNTAKVIMPSWYIWLTDRCNVWVKK